MEVKKQTPFVIGICGGSASGKTTLANKLRTVLGNSETIVISLDNYYHDFVRKGMDPKLVNYDHPNSFDFVMLRSHLKRFLAFEAVHIPQYDFNTHSRCPDTRLMPPANFIIVEGLFLYNIPELKGQFRIKIFVDTPAGERLHRRVARDTRERNRNRESVVKQFERDVAPMHNKFVEPNKMLADIIVSGNKPYANILPGIRQEIIHLLY